MQDEGSANVWICMWQTQRREQYGQGLHIFRGGSRLEVGQGSTEVWSGGWAQMRRPWKLPLKLELTVNRFRGSCEVIAEQLNECTAISWRVCRSHWGLHNYREGNLLEGMAMVWGRDSEDMGEGSWSKRERKDLPKTHFGCEWSETGIYELRGGNDRKEKNSRVNAILVWVKLLTVVPRLWIQEGRPNGAVNMQRSKVLVLGQKADPGGRDLGVIGM